MAIDFSNIAGNIRDKEGNTPKSQNQSSSSNVPDMIQVGTNPQNDQPIFVQSQASKEKDLAEKKAAILALAGNGRKQPAA